MSPGGSSLGDSPAARRNDRVGAPEPVTLAGLPTDRSHPAAGTRFINRLRQALTVEAIVCAAAAVLLAWLVVYPLLVLLIGSVRTDLPMRPGTLTLANFTKLFA